MEPTDNSTDYGSVDCGDTFSVTEGEAAWYVERNLNLPRRCRDCRLAKRERNAARA